ncbi:MAG: glycosyltransferase [Bacteriovoracaceae bacterium]
MIIITRNRAALLTKALQAIVKQTLMPSEIIVVDNGSTDSTQNIVKSFTKLPIYYFFEPKVGRAIARNCGIEKAKFELILFTDDDCLLPADWVEKMVELQTKHPHVLAIYGSVEFYGENRAVVAVAQLLNDKFNSDNLYKKDQMSYSRSFDTANLSMKKSFFKNYGLFNSNLSATQDVELAKRINEQNDIILYEASLVVKHFARSSLTKLLYQYFSRGFYLVKWEQKSIGKVVGEFFCFPLYLLQIVKSVRSLNIFSHLFLALLAFNLGTLVGITPTRKFENLIK